MCGVVNNRMFEVRAWDKSISKMIDFDTLLQMNDREEIRLIDEMIGRFPTNLKFMQNINIKDKNNNWIYEGDIVKIYDSYTSCTSAGVVDFQDGSFIIRNDSMTHYRWYDYDLEILGNVFANRELLTGGIILWNTEQN